jgi:hypothetical protein
MHPLGMYLTITDRQHDQSWVPDESAPSPTFADARRAAARAVAAPIPVGRFARLAASIRQRVARTTAV